MNNAGIGVMGPLEFVPIEDIRRQLEINFIGQVAMTQAFLPALRLARGRIVNVSSSAAATALRSGPYNASKFALEGVSDALRRELRRLGVEVVLIEPGGEALIWQWQKGRELADKTTASMPPEADRLYGPLVEALRTQTARIERETGIPPRAPLPR